MVCFFEGVMGRPKKNVPAKNVPDPQSLKLNVTNHKMSVEYFTQRFLKLSNMFLVSKTLGQNFKGTL